MSHRRATTLTTEHRSEVQANVTRYHRQTTDHKQRYCQNQSYHASKNGSPPQLSKTFRTKTYAPVNSGEHRSGSALQRAFKGFSQLVRFWILIFCFGYTRVIRSGVGL
jgi:hypothetical protein